MDARPIWAVAPVGDDAPANPDNANPDNEATEAVPLQTEQIWLLGQPTLDNYLDHVRKNVIGGSQIAPSTIVDEWRAANDYYFELEAAEAGLADTIDVRDLPAAMHPLAAEVMAHASYRRAFNILPTRFAMVQLEHLVAGQRRIDHSHVKRLKERLPAQLSPEELFTFCLPLDRRDVEFKIRRAGRNRYTISSDSSDLRFQEAVMLRPSQIVGHDAKGTLGGALGIFVGFGSNFLTAIQANDRVLLNNGHHRACALLEHGITHAPCIIETVTRSEELNLVAGAKIQETPAFYFKAARPPLLKDFLDPKIRKIMHIPRVIHSIDITFEVQDYEVEA